MTLATCQAPGSHTWRPAPALAGPRSGRAPRTALSGHSGAEEDEEAGFQGRPVGSRPPRGGRPHAADHTAPLRLSATSRRSAGRCSGLHSESWLASSHPPGRVTVETPHRFLTLPVLSNVTLHTQRLRGPAPRAGGPTLQCSPSSVPGGPSLTLVLCESDHDAGANRNDLVAGNQL